MSCFEVPKGYLCTRIDTIRPRGTQSNELLFLPLSGLCLSFFVSLSGCVYTQTTFRHPGRDTSEAHLSKHSPALRWHVSAPTNLHTCSILGPCLKTSRMGSCDLPLFSLSTFILHLSCPLASFFVLTFFCSHTSKKQMCLPAKRPPVYIHNAAAQASSWINKRGSNNDATTSRISPLGCT